MSKRVDVMTRFEFRPQTETLKRIADSMRVRAPLIGWQPIDTRGNLRAQLKAFDWQMLEVRDAARYWPKGDGDHE